MARRDLLHAAAGLVVAFAAPGAAIAGPTTTDSASVDGYLAIDVHGKVTVFSGKVDLGTGARAALRQIVADELGAGYDDIDLVEGDTGLTPDQGSTGGSTGISVGGAQIRQAAATARAYLLGLAADRLQCPASTLEVVAGNIRPLAGSAAEPSAAAMSSVLPASTPILPNFPTTTAGAAARPDDGSRSISFAALFGGQQFAIPVDPAAPLDPKPRLVGTSVPRPDLPAKFTGRHVYVQDFRLDGMLHGRVIRPPTIGGRLGAVDASSIAGIPDVQIVRIGNFLGVVAPREWDAIRAAQALKAEWTHTETMPPFAYLYPAVRATQMLSEETLRHDGDTIRAIRDAAKVVVATYRWPIQSHASLGPSCAVADIKRGAGTVWTASQNTHRQRRLFAGFLDIPFAKMRMIYLDGSGSYGSNGNDDAAADAALMSRAVRAPVRVQWSRADEHGWDPKGPPQLIDLSGALDASGSISAWQSRAHLPANTPQLASVALLAWNAAGLPQAQGNSSGQIHFNADPPYAIANVLTLARWLDRTPLRPSNLRAPGKIGNVFAVESFFDEMAAAARVDPLAMRLRGLADPRAQAVLRQVGAAMGWQPRTGPVPSGPVQQGRGVAYVHYKQAENHVAIGMQVAVDRASGAIRVIAVFCAHDCGRMINPDAVRAQVEGCILQTLSRTLFEQVVFDKSRVTSTDWASYPILTFPDVPRLEIMLIDRPDQPSLGAGEAACAPVAAALGNAVFDATGVRLRTVPFTPALVKAAMRPA